MKNLCLLLAASFLLVSCKKAKEDIQENLIMQAMTGGQWKVVNFMKGTTNQTGDFADYRFQFKENGTVDALYTGSLEKTGTWSADPDARTFTSHFSAPSTPTLSLLNGTWQITDNSWTYVVAKQTVNSEQWTLRLEKQ